MEPPTQTPDEIIQETEKTYGPELVAGVTAATLDFLVDNEYEQDFKTLSNLIELLRSSETNAKSLGTKPLQAPTKESVAANDRAKCKAVKARDRPAASKQHWKNYRWQKARRAYAKLEAAVLRKALSEHEKAMKEKYSDGEMFSAFNRVPAPQPDDLERAESTRLGFPDLY